MLAGVTTAALRPGEPLIAGLKRVLAEMVAAALGELDESKAGADEIHRARRHLKMARTIARLLAPALGDEAEGLRAQVRAAMAVLSARRDSHVIAATAEKLAAKLSERRAARLAALAREPENALRPLSEDVGEARAFLARLAETIARLPGDDGKEEAVRQHAAALYRKARKSWRKAVSDGAVEELHLMRKRVKDRLHLVQLFRERWPEPQRPRRRKLDRLGDLLGKDRDLWLVGEHLKQAQERARPVERLVAARRQKLERKAFELADDLFALKPKKIGRAWAAAG